MKGSFLEEVLKFWPKRLSDVFEGKCGSDNLRVFGEEVEDR